MNNATSLPCHTASEHQMLGPHASLALMAKICVVWDAIFRARCPPPGVVTGTSSSDDQLRLEACRSLADNPARRLLSLVTQNIKQTTPKSAPPLVRLKHSARGLDLLMTRIACVRLFAMLKLVRKNRRANKSENRLDRHCFKRTGSTKDGRCATPARDPRKRLRCASPTFVAQFK